MPARSGDRDQPRPTERTRTAIAQADRAGSMPARPATPKAGGQSQPRPTGGAEDAARWRRQAPAVGRHRRRQEPRGPAGGTPGRDPPGDRAPTAPGGPSGLDARSARNAQARVGGSTKADGWRRGCRRWRRQAPAVGRHRRRRQAPAVGRHRRRQDPSAGSRASGPVGPANPTTGRGRAHPWRSGRLHLAGPLDDGELLGIAVGATRSCGPSCSRPRRASPGLMFEAFTATSVA